MLEDANEVQEALGRTYGMPEIDEEELEGQLDALLDDMALVRFKQSKKRKHLIDFFLHFRMTIHLILTRLPVPQKPQIASQELTV
jgi:hypothetical protein